MRDVSRDRYTLRTMTQNAKAVYGYALQHVGWWLYDWREMKTVKTFPKEEKEQAEGLCRLLNSIEEETNGVQK